MADLIIQDTTLQAIADAIRAKTGGSEALTPSQMASEVTDKLSAGGAGGGSDRINALLDKTIEGYISSDTATKIEAYFFQNCASLEGVDLPNVTTIGSSAFEGATSLKNVNAPNVTTMGSGIFRNCKELVRADFPLLEKIPSFGFEGCSKLESVEFANPTQVYERTFYNCVGLKSVNLPKVSAVQANAFYYCKELETANFGTLTTIGSDAFNGCSKLKSIEDTSNITQLPGYAFRQCKSLETANFPKVTTMLNSADFENCQSLTSINFPLLTTVYHYSFRYCYKLPKVYLPAVTNLGSASFSTCYALKSAIFPKLSRITGAKIFENCSVLIKLLIGTEIETVCSLSNSTLFNESTFHMMGKVDAEANPNGLKDGYIYVPNALVASYRTATNWSTYASQIFPWVATIEELANIDTTLYDKACVGYENDGIEYSYDGTQWTEVIR